MKQRHDLTAGPVYRHILRMTPPMAVAFFAMMAFNLADTWFVSLLGTAPLAAMGFTFPIIMILHSIAMGLGIGTSACVSRVIGMKDQERVQHITTYAMVLAFMCFMGFALGGWFAAPSILTIMGASGGTHAMALQYIRILLCFIPLAALPMIGNNAIRATGDTLTPSVIMSTAALINVVLDPVFIFGAGPIPAMGIRGAALATGLSRLITMFWAVRVLHSRCRLLTIRWVGWSELFRCWGQVLHVALPAAGTNVLMPVTFGFITRMIAGYGEKAVAATAAGQRIEHFAYLVPIAMGSVLVPLIGQNWGAGRIDRVREAWIKVNWYGVIYALGCLALAFPFAGKVAAYFSRAPEIIRLITHYLWIMMMGSLMIHITVHTGFAFNAVQRPLRASMLVVLRLLGMVIPLSWLGSRLFGVYGIYSGIALGSVITGFIAMAWFSRVLRRAAVEQAAKELEAGGDAESRAVLN